MFEIYALSETVRVARLVAWRSEELGVNLQYPLVVKVDNRQSKSFQEGACLRFTRQLILRLLLGLRALRFCFVKVTIHLCEYIYYCSQDACNMAVCLLLTERVVSMSRPPQRPLLPYITMEAKPSPLVSMQCCAVVLCCRLGNNSARGRSPVRDSSSCRPPPSELPLLACSPGVLKLETSMSSWLSSASASSIC